MYERNFHWDNLTVQLRQFVAFLDTSNISVTKLFESLVNFGKNKSQKMLLPEVTKFAKLLFVLAATNATSERSFSAMKRIKTYLSSSTSGKRLTHLTWLKLPRNSSATIKQDWEHLAAFENITNSPRITIFKTKTERQNVVSYKSNMKQYFCQCSSVILVDDLKLIFFIPSNEKSLSTPLQNFFLLL